MSRVIDEERYRRLLIELAEEVPDFHLVDKASSLLQRSIALLLALVTLGGQRRYQSDFVTTLGQRVYVPPDWDGRPPEERWATLRHERIHLRQFRRWGLIPMGIAYALLPLPIGLAWFRMRIERAAYAETLLARFEVGGEGALCDAAFRAHVVSLFTGGSYGWMWPFPRAVERWYDETVKALVASEAGS